MTSKGKQLESLVAFVESILLPEGFVVTTNQRVFNDNGVQIAEFDIEIRGKVGSTDFVWLIECRDRPSHGPAPCAWIEQLVGRRGRFRFNKVTAVSTTGFAAGVAEYAQREGIELREVKTLSPDTFTDWFQVEHFQHIERLSTLVSAGFLIRETESIEKQTALDQLIATYHGGVPFLKSSKTGKSVSPTTLFSFAVSRVSGIFDDVIYNGPEKKIKLHTNLHGDDPIVIETAKGTVQVVSIVFDGELRLIQRIVPLLGASEYLHTENGEVISKVISFAPHAFFGTKYSTEIHKMSDTGNIYVVLRPTEIGS